VSNLNRQQRRKLARAIANGKVGIPQNPTQHMAPHVEAAFLKAKEAESLLGHTTQIVSVLTAAKEAFEAFEQHVPIGDERRDDDYAGLHKEWSESYATALYNRAAAALDFAQAVAEYETARLEPAPLIVTPSLEVVS
jgi:hypothetical protein